MVIELIGTPGAGKTTLVPAIQEHLRENDGIQAYTVVEASRIFASRTVVGRIVTRMAPQILHRALLWQIFIFHSFIHRCKFSAKHSRLVKQVLQSQLRRPQAAGVRKRRVLKWFFHLAGCYEFITSRACPFEAFVLDEGFVHRVVQMNASVVEKPDLATITAYVDLLPRPDIVIVPLAPVHVCEQRVIKRGVWRQFQDKSPEEISIYLSNSYQVVQMTTDYLKHKGWTVIEVNNGGNDLTDSFLELKNELAKLLTYSPQRSEWLVENSPV
jgi:thymidylate kinase